jgi:hypothetical protein
MTERIPLADASGQEIVARTVYQLILIDYRTNPEQYDRAPSRLFDLALQWRQAGLHLVADELSSVAVWCAQGGTVATWLRTRILVSTGRATILARAGRTRRR